MHLEVGPVVLILEVVQDLKGERVQTGKVCGSRQFGRVCDEHLHLRWRDCHFGAGLRRHSGGGGQQRGLAIGGAMFRTRRREGEEAV